MQVILISISLEGFKLITNLFINIVITFTLLATFCLYNPNNIIIFYLYNSNFPQALQGYSAGMPAASASFIIEIAMSGLCMVADILILLYQRPVPFCCQDFIFRVKFYNIYKVFRWKSLWEV